MVYRETVIEEIWDGALWFEDVEVVGAAERWKFVGKPPTPQARRRSQVPDKAAAPAPAPAATQPAE